MLTLPTSSASRRLLTSRAVSCEPSRPANGDVLIPTVIDRLGSSIVMTGSGRGSSGSASVSPIVISGIPATATISPGPAGVGRDTVERLGGVQLGDARPLDGAVGAAPGDGAPLAQRSRSNAAQGEASDVRRGIEVGDERLQGHRRIERRRRDAFDEKVEQRGQGQPVGEPGAVAVVAPSTPCRRGTRNRRSGSRAGPWRRRGRETAPRRRGRPRRCERLDGRPC